MTKICIIAGNYHEALSFAKAQSFDPDDWFTPADESDLTNKSNFHVIVVGTAGMNTPASYFNRIYNLALERGRIGR